MSCDCRAIGIVFGITLTVTKKDGVLENKVVFQFLDKAINLFRSVPFIILLTGVMPLSRLIMGTAIGVKGAIVPLVFGTVPFFSRQIEAAIDGIDFQILVEADYIVNLMEGYCKRESIPEMKKNIFKTETGKYLLEQMFEKSVR